jgi:hypothetical protein
MATIDITKQFDSHTKLIYHITAVGADGATEQSLIDISAIESPSLGAPDGELTPVLLEASWSINAGYDHVKLFYHDEGNDEVILLMSGDGSYNATGFGGGAIDVEAATPVEADYDVLFDLVEAGDEDTGSAADIVLVFKKRGPSV